MPLVVHRNINFTSFRILLLLIAFLTGCREKGEQVRHVEVPATSQKTQSKLPESRQQRLQAASRLVETEAMDLAEPAIRSLLIETPDDLEANALMLRVLVHRRDITGAVSILDHIALLNPARADDMQAHAANLLSEGGDVDQAIVRFESLLARSPGFNDARRRLAQILNQQGYLFDANEQIRELAKHALLTRDELVSLIFPKRSWISTEEVLDSNDESQQRRLGLLTIAIAQSVNGTPRAAIASLQDSELIADKKNLAAIAFYGRTLADAQMYPELHEWVASAPIQCERYPDYWIGCGNLAIQTDDEVAIACFVEAIEREPGSLEAHNGMIVALQRAGQTSLAEQFRQRTYVLDSIGRDVRKIRESPRPDAKDFIGVATQLMSIGRPMEAIAWQEYALSLFSPNSEQMSLIPTYKTRVLKEFPTGQDNQIVLCELDRARLVLAKDWLRQQRQAEPHRLTNNHKLWPGGNRPELPLIVPAFRNVAAQWGLHFRYQNASPPVERGFQIFQAFGGGVACLDFDRDGSVDFYFGQAATTPPNGISAESNGLYRNLGLAFVDVIQKADADNRGYTVGVTAGDWNQDGFADLLIGNLGRNQLLINQGDGTFLADTGEVLGANSAFTSSVAIADVTGDALPDIVEINYLDDASIFDPIKYGSDGKPVSLPGPLQFRPAMDRLLVSVGDGSMLSQPLGNQDESGYSTGLGLLITDIDGTIGNDVYVANDLRANQLWVRGHGSGGAESTWTDIAVNGGVAYGGSGKPMASMGIAAADFDGNGHLDLHITNFEDEWSNQYMQMKSGLFVDLAVPYKLDVISRKMLGFGTQAIDYDNNTIWDLVVGNGHIEDLTAKGSLFAMPTQLLVGRLDGFLEQKVAGDDDYWNGLHFSRAMAKCDFNRDGRVDIVITDLKRDAVLLANMTTTPNHWLQLELVGTSSERDAIGTTVSAEFASTSLVQVVQTGDGYLAKNEAALFFGLGSAQSVERLRIRWPSGMEQTLENLRCDSRLLLVEGEATPWNAN